MHEVSVSSHFLDLFITFIFLLSFINLKQFLLPFNLPKVLVGRSLVLHRQGDGVNWRVLLQRTFILSTNCAHNPSRSPRHGVKRWCLQRRTAQMLERKFEHFSRWTDHDSNCKKQGKGKVQSNGKMQRDILRTLSGRSTSRELQEPTSARWWQLEREQTHFQYQVVFVHWTV